MKIRISLSFVAFYCFTIQCVFAQTYNTVDEESGDWHDASTWTTAMAGTSSGGTTSLDVQFSTTNIRGKITISENLEVKPNKATLNVNSTDTLIVVGDFSAKGNLVVESAGVLIITGNATFEGNSSLDNDAVIVVLGDFSATGSSSITSASGAGEGIYVFGSTTDPGTTKTSGEAESEIPGLYSEFIAPLPIELLSFNARPTSQSVMVSWTTATEENFDFFTLERAGADLQFEAVGSITGHGFSTIPIDYQLEDRNPRAGANYYRLKATDLDGSVEYHNVINVWFESANLVQMYPNPVLNHQFTIVGAVSQIQLVNIMGHIVLTKPVGGEQLTVDLPQNVKPGNYIALVTYLDGSQERRSLIVR